MHRPALFALCLAAAPALAEETTSLGAHEHGVGALNVAFDGARIAMELHAPGADIVGFEHPAKSAEDKAAVTAAKDVLTAPLTLFAFSEAAGCTVDAVEVALEFEGADGHADGHGHDHGHAHDHGHGHDHEAEGGHSEFHAEYALTCANPGAIAALMTEGYFTAFPAARELEVQIAGPGGSAGFELSAEVPAAVIGGLM
ncbi:MAG: DUF2796 domain-containing protein [Pseudomonadota bacterium]